jgi:hypothetical protein
VDWAYNVDFETLLFLSSKDQKEVASGFQKTPPTQATSFFGADGFLSTPFLTSVNLNKDELLGAGTCIQGTHNHLCMIQLRQAIKKSCG